MKKIHYSSPVDKLITYKILQQDCGHDHHHDHGDCEHDHHDHGDCGHDHHDHDDFGHAHHHRKEWDNYLELGLKKEHVPELIKMLFDYNLHNSDDATEVWAPIHALRTLGQLGAEEAAEPIIKLLEKFEDDDWIFVDAVDALVKIGKSSLPHVAKILKNDRKSDSLRMACCSTVQKIGTTYDNQKECAEILKAQLQSFRNNSRFLNGLIISDLLTLNASDAFPIIKEAFDANCVFNAVCGDLEDVEVVFGLREKRATEPQYENIRDFGKPHEDAPPPSTPSKIGRNDPCSCGSGKKYKKCCMNK